MPEHLSSPHNYESKIIPVCGSPHYKAFYKRCNDSSKQRDKYVSGVSFVLPMRKWKCLQLMLDEPTDPGLILSNRWCLSSCFSLRYKSTLCRQRPIVGKEIAVKTMSPLQLVRGQEPSSFTYTLEQQSSGNSHLERVNKQTLNYLENALRNVTFKWTQSHL